MCYRMVSAILPLTHRMPGSAPFTCLQTLLNIPGGGALPRKSCRLTPTIMPRFSGCPSIVSLGSVTFNLFLPPQYRPLSHWLLSLFLSVFCVVYSLTVGRLIIRKLRCHISPCSWCSGLPFCAPQIQASCIASWALPAPGPKLYLQTHFSAVLYCLLQPHRT